MYKINHAPQELTTGNPFVDEGYVELLATRHEEDIIYTALKLLVNEQDRSRIMGNSSPLYSDADEVLNSFTQRALSPREDPRLVVRERFNNRLL